jgi:hypothetical protein
LESERLKSQQLKSLVETSKVKQNDENEFRQRENSQTQKAYLKNSNSADIYKNGKNLEQICSDLEKQNNSLEQALAQEKSKYENQLKIYNELKNTQLKNSNIEVRTAINKKIFQFITFINLSLSIRHLTVRTTTWSVLDKR